MAIQPQECALLGSQVSAGSGVQPGGQGRGAGGFVVCPSFSESSSTVRLIRRPVWKRPPSSRCEAFLAACSVRNNEIAEPSPSSRGFCGKQPAIINRRYLYFHFLAFKVFWNNSFGLFWVIFFAYFLCWAVRFPPF